MADTKITALTAATSLDPTDLFAIVTAVATTPATKKITAANLSVWTAWSPAVTNLTVGDGTLACTYLRLGHQVEVNILFTLGASSAVGTAPHIALPVTPVNAGSWTVKLKDTGTADYLGTADISASELYIKQITASGTYATYSGITATVPFTWTTGDIIQIHGVYGI